MNEPTEIKYSLDESEEPYYAATHIKAVAGLDFADDGDLMSIIFDLQNEVRKINKKLLEQDSIVATYNERIAKIETIIQNKEGE
ncbi:MAG: hypothetical protein ACTIBX_10665 [Staphylococcus saprophyticus]